MYARLVHACVQVLGLHTPRERYICTLAAHTHTDSNAYYIMQLCTVHLHSVVLLGYGEEGHIKTGVVPIVVRRCMRATKAESSKGRFGSALANGMILI